VLRRVRREAPHSTRKPFNKDIDNIRHLERTSSLVLWSGLGNYRERFEIETSAARSVALVRNFVARPRF
jgi:hypothetical protein